MCITPLKYLYKLIILQLKKLKLYWVRLIWYKSYTNLISIKITILKNKKTNLIYIFKNIKCEFHIGIAEYIKKY